jgi:hypothetical protein
MLNRICYLPSHDPWEKSEDPGMGSRRHVWLCFIVLAWRRCRVKLLRPPLFAVHVFQHRTYDDLQLASLSVIPSVDGRNGKLKEIYFKVPILGRIDQRRENGGNLRDDAIGSGGTSGVRGFLGF